MLDNKVQEVAPESKPPAASDTKPALANHREPPTNLDKGRSQLPQAVAADPLTHSLQVLFDAEQIAGYLQACADVQVLIHQCVPIKSTTLLALMGSKMRGDDRDARIKAAWEAA